MCRTCLLVAMEVLTVEITDLVLFDSLIGLVYININMHVLLFFVVSHYNIREGQYTLLSHAYKAKPSSMCSINYYCAC